MASSRRVGSNENITTYGDGTRDETDMDVWEAATDIDLVAAAKSEVLECYDDAANFNDDCALVGATTSSLYARFIRPASGEGHDGTPNNGVYFKYLGTRGATININEPYSSAQDLILEHVRSLASTSNSSSHFVGPRLVLYSTGPNPCIRSAIP